MNASLAEDLVGAYMSTEFSEDFPSNFIYDDSGSEQEYVMENKYEDLQLVARGYLVVVVGGLGVIGNILCLVILSRREMRSSLNYGLQTLAVFDGLNLLTRVLSTGLYYIALRSDALWISMVGMHSYMFLICRPLQGVGYGGSLWTTLGLSAERYIAVCHPLKERIICTHRNAKLFNVFLGIWAVFINLPSFFEHTFEEAYDGLANKTVHITKMSSIYNEHTAIFDFFYTYVATIMIFVIPYPILVVLNILTWNTVRKSNVARGNMSAQQRKNISLTKMVFCIITIFFICNVPIVVNNILVSNFSIIFYPLIHMTDLLICVNSAVNIIIYCIFSSKFRDLFVRIFFSCFKTSEKNTCMCMRRPKPQKSGTSKTSKEITRSTHLSQGESKTCEAPKTSAIALVSFKKNNSPDSALA